METENMPYLSEIDRVRLAETFRLGAYVQEALWPGWKEAPFAVLLVTPEHEFLVRHPQPSEEFEDLGYDRLLKSRVYCRETQFPTNLLATFPAVNGLSTIVVGQAENTFVKTSTPWVATLLHEHFHQWQDSQPGIYAEMAALGLSRGDQTGMWMLDYPFPYTDPEVNAAFSNSAQALVAAYGAVETPEFAERLMACQAARQRLRQAVSEEDYRYLQFQLWKEGVARYTELLVAVTASGFSGPRSAFTSLPDYTPYTRVATDIQEGIFRALSEKSLEQAQRGLFYAYGAAQALVLDFAQPDWQQRYLQEKFCLDPYFDAL